MARTDSLARVALYASTNGLELVLPVSGNGYAGDAKDRPEGQALVGSLLYLSGRVWGVVAAVKTVEAYNKSLLSGEPQKERIGVKVVFRF